MPDSLLRALRLAGIAVLTYLLIALLQTLVLEVGLHGEVTVGAPAKVVLLGTLGTIGSGLIGGWIAAQLGGKRPLRHVAGVLTLLLVDTVFVILRDADGEPLWWSLGGSLTLLAATAAGGLLRRRALVNSGVSGEVPRDRDPAPDRRLT